MRVIIAGSRGVNDPELVELAMQAADEVWGDCPAMTEVVSGGARGVDFQGERWAQAHGVPVKRFLPDWDGLGKKAGFVRNREMAEYAAPNGSYEPGGLVVIWDGASRGTWNMVLEAERRGMLILLYCTARTDKVERLSESAERVGGRLFVRFAPGV